MLKKHKMPSHWNGSAYSSVRLPPCRKNMMLKVDPITAQNAGSAWKNLRNAKIPARQPKVNDRYSSVHIPQSEPLPINSPKALIKNITGGLWSHKSRYGICPARICCPKYKKIPESWLGKCPRPMSVANRKMTADSEKTNNKPQRGASFLMRKTTIFFGAEWKKSGCFTTSAYCLVINIRNWIDNNNNQTKGGKYWLYVFTRPDPMVTINKNDDTKRDITAKNPIERSASLQVRTSWI